jgi:ADP-heptose:LPS heptosyltransferase
MLRRNVLIFHSGALGDFVLTWPVAMALARIYPQSRVFYVTAGEKGKLAERVLGVEAKDAEGGWQHLFGDPGKLPEPVRRTLEGAQLVVNFVAGGPDAWVKNVRATSGGCDVTTIRPRPPEPTKEATHASQFLADQLGANRVVQSAVGQMIASANEKGAGSVWKGTGTTVVHPGSGSRDKCWPAAKWIELLAGLTTPVRVVLGEVERERFAATDLNALEQVAEVRWPATYLDLLAELATASAFIGNDSGPGHLAGIIGVPTVSLFGPTDPDVWRPMGPRVRVVRGVAIDRIGVEQVRNAWDAVRRQSPVTANSVADDD